MDNKISVKTLLNFLSSKLKVQPIDSTEENTISCEAFYKVTPQELIEFIHDELNKNETIFRLSGPDLIGAFNRNVNSGDKLTEE